MRDVDERERCCIGRSRGGGEKANRYKQIGQSDLAQAFVSVLPLPTCSSTTNTSLALRHERRDVKYDALISRIATRVGVW